MQNLVSLRDLKYIKKAEGYSRKIQNRPECNKLSKGKYNEEMFFTKTKNKKHNIKK